MDKKRKQILFPLLGIILLYILQFITHRSIPFMMDDEWYSTNLATGGPLRTLADVLEGQIWHYLNWGGRSITHGILQLVLMTGELCADILNVLMTMLLAYMICVVSGQKNLRHYLLYSSLMICFNANAKMSMFWQSGLVNYVYSSVWILAFLWPYLKVADGSAEATAENAAETTAESVAANSAECSENSSVECAVGRKNKMWDLLAAACMLPLGLMSGWSNENMGPAGFCIAVLVIIYRRMICKKGCPLWMYAGAAASLAGSVLVILAPGNFVRSAAVDVTTSGNSLVRKLFDRFFDMFEAGAGFLFPVVILLAVLLIYYMTVISGKLKNSQILLLIGMVLSYGAMVLSPHYPDRATFGTMVWGIVVIGGLIERIEKKSSVFRKWVCVMQVTVWLYSIRILLEIIMNTGV